MGLIDTEGQGITPETLSRSERQQYEHAKRQAQKCENLHQIEAYAYAHLVRGFSEATITGGGALEDGDINVLLAFGNTFNSDDLLKCPWPEVSADKYHATHKLFRSPWITRAADALGYEHFQALVLRAVDVTRALVAEQDSYCDEDLACLGWHERAYLVHDEMQKHYPQFAKAFDPYASDDYDCDHYDDWAAEESIKVTAAAAYAVNHTATTGPRASNPSPTPRRQTGGSDSEDPASADHDSHVQTYLYRLICWTSALEVVSAAIPAAKTIQKDTRYIGKLRLELADYPADFTPDYSFLTLNRAAFEVGYTAGPGALDQVLQSTVGVSSHSLYRIYSLFKCDTLVNDLNDQQDEADNEILKIREEWSKKDLTARMREVDPAGYSYEKCAGWAKRFLSRRVNDQMYDDMVLSAWHEGYISALRTFDPSAGYSFHSHAHRRVASIAGREALKKSKDYVNGQAIRKEIEDVENKLKRSHLSGAQRDSLSRHLEFLQTARGRNFLIINNDPLDAPISDDEGSISRVDTLLGEHQDTTHSALHSQTVATVEYLLSAIGDSLMREVYISKHVHEMKTGEISSLYGITQDKVRKYLSKAQAILSQAAAVRNIRGEDYY